MKTSEQINELATALAKAQGQIHGAPKESANPFFNSRYADLASVWAACRQALSSNGLSVVQIPRIEFLGEPEFRTLKTRNGDERLEVQAVTKIAVITRLLHVSGQWVESELQCMVPKGDPQSIGSAITYLRRYSLAPLVGVVAEEDDDGNAASQATLNGGATARAVTPQMPPEQKAFNQWIAPFIDSRKITRDEVRGILEAHQHDYAATRVEITKQLKGREQSGASSNG